MSLGEGLQLIAGILIVILAAYYATYFIANRKIKRAPGRGINVRERFSLSKDKMVCVVEVNGRAYLVVITNGGATLLDTFDIGEFETAEAEKPEGAHAQQGYEPNGMVARGIWKLFNAFKNATYAKTVRVRNETRTNSDGFTDAEETGRDLHSGRTDYTIRVAREEDGIDEIQRRLKSRMAASPDSEEESRGE